MRRECGARSPLALKAGPPKVPHGRGRVHPRPWQSPPARVRAGPRLRRLTEAWPQGRNNQTRPRAAPTARDLLKGDSRSAARQAP
eukprot:15457566-Alexandrium_andersonii.AAC.1